MSKKAKFNQISNGWNIAISAILILASITVVLPLILVAVISISSGESIALNGYTFFPTKISFDAYRNLAKTGSQIRDSYLVTIFHSFAGTVMSLFVMSMFAYTLSQKKVPGRNFMTFLAFFTMLFSGGLVPTYMLNVRYLHLNDTIWIFLLPSLVNAFYLIILRTFMQTSIPESLTEAAIIDGAGYFRVYVSIIMPLSKAGLATIGLFSLVNRWNDWFTGMLYIDNAKLVPLQTVLQRIQRNIDFIKNNSRNCCDATGSSAVGFNAI